MRKKNKIIRQTVLLVLISVFVLSVFTACGSKGHAVTDKASLTGARVGVQIGTTGDTDVSALKHGTKVQRFDKGADAINTLKQGKLDAVVIDGEVAKAFVKQNPDLKILDEPFETEEYAGVIAKNNTELLDKVNKAMAEIKEEGILDNLYDTYINEKGDYHYKEKVTSGDTLVMASSIDFPPYEYFDNGSSTPTGFDVEMAYAIADKLGMKLEIQNIQFDAIINAVNSGKADIGLSGFTVTEERKKSINFTSNYMETQQAIIVQKGGAGNGQSFGDKLYNSFIKDHRFNYLLSGLVNTIIITIFAVLIGVVLGFLIALVRVTHDRNGNLKVLNFIAKLYLTIVRGTPMMIQLLIIYFVIFASVDISKVLVAIIAFGLNSAAYQAENFRSGIMAVDAGQFEAGHSLGLKYGTVMTSIILPQAVKNVLPAIANEFISLLKETSISGYIGLQDLTQGGMIIRSITYEAMVPLLAVAVIYLVIVLLLTWLVGKLEKALRKNER